MSTPTLAPRRTVIVDGCRTPFLRASTGYNDLMAYELGAMAISALVDRNRLDPEQIDRVIMGTVLAEPKTSNVAREIGLAAGLPLSTPAFTVTAACTSANVAVASAVEAISARMADIVIAGGVETLSDVPIRFRRKVRQRLIAAQKARGPLDFLKYMSGLKPSDFEPEAPAIAEFTTGLTMGDNAERMAKRFGITRRDQDEFALSSHHRAAKATADGKLGDQIVWAFAPPSYQAITQDNAIRGDSTMAKLESLAPVFDRQFGTVTAGNSSPLTDGGAAVLLMSEEKAAELGVQPLAAIKSYAFVAMDPREELLLGPTLAIPQALDRAGLHLDEIGVLELHEAFAAQMVATIRLLEDAEFCRQRLGRPDSVGKVDLARTNAWGGSLSIGHPFGATGARLVTTAARRMIAENARYGLVSACAAGAEGHAMVLERL